MKKTLITLAIIAIVIVAGICINNITSGPEYTVINQSSKASPAGVFAQSVRNTIDGQWYQSSNCTDATKKFNGTQDAIMIYNSSVGFAALNKKLDNCQLDEVSNSNAKVVLVSSSRMLICQLANADTNLLTDKVTLGMASMYAVTKHEAQWNANGADIKIVPYSGSKTVLQALIAGDINWGWMGESLALKQGDKLDCQYSTDPNSKNFLGNTAPNLVIPDFRINIVVYTNSNNVEDLKETLKNSKFFQNYIKSSKNQLEDNVDVSTVDQYVQRMYNTWAN